MPKQYRYYLGRISKGGALSTDELIDAILKPITIKKNNYSYTFANMHYDPTNNYIFGRLVKFMPEGEVETIELHEHRETSVQISHKKESSSPFIIALDYMGIAYPTIWNNLQHSQFERYFSELIREKFDNLLISCEIEPVVDLKSFVQHVANMDKIDKINATVMPPNPLFGPVWKELKDYMENRGSGEITISEKSKYANGLKTKLIDIMSTILQTNELKARDKKEENLVNKKYDITDAAILMAADGYGRAKIEGSCNGAVIVIRTKDNQKNFLFDKDPEIQEFFEIVASEFEKINQERHLKH